MQGVLGPAKPSARQSWLGVLVICYLLSSTTKVHLLVLDRRRCTNIDRRTSSLILNQFHFRAIVLKKPVTTVHVSRLLLAAMELLPLKSVQGKLAAEHWHPSRQLGHKPFTDTLPLYTTAQLNLGRKVDLVKEVVDRSLRTHLVLPCRSGTDSDTTDHLSIDLDG